MQFIPDSFISYDNDFLVKQEKIPDHNLPLDPFFSSDAAFPYSTSIPQTLQNFLDNGEQTFSLDPTELTDWTKDRKKHQPFNIIKAKKEISRMHSPESFEVKIESDDKLVMKTKRILKREKAKQRIKIKQECNVSVSAPPSNLSLEVVNNQDLDDKSKKKMVQMIRNRISAQSSRDRKKVYLLQLEDSRLKLADENSKLNFEKEFLLKEVRKLEENQRRLRVENEELKKNMGHSDISSQFMREGDLNEEEDSEDEDFSQVFESIVGQSFNKIGKNNKKFYKSTMAFATMISIIMMLNIAKQSGAVMQDREEWVKNANLSEVQKKVLQNTDLAESLQEIREEISNSKQWDFLERLKPLLQNLEAGYRKVSMDTQADLTTGTPESLPHIVKLEDFTQEDILAHDEFLIPPGEKKSSSIFGDEKMQTEDFKKDSNIKVFELSKLKYFGSKNNFIKFTQQRGPDSSEAERQQESLFVKDEWLKVIGSQHAGFN